jgi:ATP-dependent Zn protease
MAPILEEGNIYYIQGGIEEVDVSQTDDTEVISMWVKDRDFIRATTDITLLKKIEPGVYSAEYDRNIGTYCRQIPSTTDELFIFTDSLVTNLLSEIDLFWSKKELYKQNKLLHKRGILLEGFPGTGKTSIIAIICNKIIKNGGIVFKISSDKGLNDYLLFMKSGFRKIEPDTPVITIIEDLDFYEEVEAELLDFLDGQTHINHHIVLATTNNSEDIPDTFLRPSRIDLRIEIPLPNESIREEFFKFKNVPETDIKHLVKKSEGFSLADLKELYICIYLLDYPVKDALKKIAKPREKTNYLQSPANSGNIGL